MAGFKNAKRFQGKISKLPKVVGNATRAAMEEGAQEIVDAMRRLLGPSRLADATNWCWGDPPRDSSAILVIDAGKAKLGNGVNEAKITIFSGDHDAFWARWKEFGTAPHSVAKGAVRKTGKLQDRGPHHPGTRAKPYFYPTWRSLKKRIRGKISRKVNAAIKDLAKGQV